MSDHSMSFDEMARGAFAAMMREWRPAALLAIFFSVLIGLVLYSGGPVTKAYIDYLLTGNMAVYQADMQALALTGGMGKFFLFIAVMVVLQMVAQLYCVRLAALGAERLFDGGVGAMLLRAGKFFGFLFLGSAIFGLAIGLAVIAGGFLWGMATIGKILAGLLGLACVFFLFSGLSTIYAMGYLVALDQAGVLARLRAAFRLGKAWKLLGFAAVVMIVMFIALMLLRLVLGIFVAAHIVGLVVGSLQIILGIVVGGIVVHAAGLQFFGSADGAAVAAE